MLYDFKNIIVKNSGGFLLKILLVFEKMIVILVFKNRHFFSPMKIVSITSTLDFKNSIRNIGMYSSKFEQLTWRRGSAASHSPRELIMFKSRQKF
jgi:hypothetical protein